MPASALPQALREEVARLGSAGRLAIACTSRGRGRCLNSEAPCRRHVERREVLASPNLAAESAWAVAILVGEQLPAEDSSLRLALLCGDWAGRGRAGRRDAPLGR